MLHLKPFLFVKGSPNPTTKSMIVTGAGLDKVWRTSILSMITGPWALGSVLAQMLKEQLHKPHIFKPVVLQKKILIKKKEVEDVFNSTKHMWKKKWIHYVLGKKRTHYMLIRLINLQVLSLNLDTDLQGKLKSQEAASWAQDFHVNG